MAFNIKSALGYSCSPVLYTGVDEVAWVCGNTLVLHNVSVGTQRILPGTSFGIQCYTTNRAHGLIAIAEKAPSPRINIYSAAELEQIGSVTLGYELGYTALAFSADGERLAICGDAPNSSIVVCNWRNGLEVLVQANLAKPAHMVSFQPYDANVLATTGGGLQSVWRVEKLWDRFDFTQHEVHLGGAYEPSSHAWFTQGLYSGTSTGELFAVDPATMQPFLAAAPESEQPPEDELLAPPTEAPAAAAGGFYGSEPGRATPPTGDVPAPPPAADAEQPPAAEGEAAVGAVLKLETGSGGPILMIAVNRDLVAVGGPTPTVRMFSHAQAPNKPAPYLGAPLGPGFEPRYEHTYGVAGLASIDFGGEGFCSLAVGTLEGCVHTTELGMHPHGGGVVREAPGEAHTETLAEAHVGAVTGLGAHPFGSQVVSCGADGTLRVWDAAAGGARPVSKRTFSSAQTCMAVCASRPLVAVGSETGVVRLVSLALNATRPLQVTFRRRLHAGPVAGCAFSPNGDWLATVGRDNCVWFSLLDFNGNAMVMGHVVCPEPVLCITWPHVAGSEDCVLVSLASGGVLCCAVPAELQNKGHPSIHPGLQLTSRDVTIKVVKVEAPLLSMVQVPGERYGELFGLGTDKMLHKIILPSDNQAWSGIKGRVNKSTLKVPTHHRPEGVINICTSHQLLLTASADGHVGTHTQGLNTIGTTMGDYFERGGFATGEAPPSGPHDVSAGGGVAVAFEKNARYFLSAGTDGSLFLYETEGHAHITRDSAKHLRPLAPSVMDLDAFDEEHEMTEADAHRRHAGDTLATAPSETSMAGGEHHPHAPAAPSPTPPPAPHLPPPPPHHSGSFHDKGATMQHLTKLRAQLVECMKRNEAAPELERIDRNTFIIHKQLVAELKAQADARVAAVHQGVRREHLQLELVAQRVRATCYDNLEQRGQRITAMKSGVEVRNFPLAKYDDSRLRKVMTLRRVEMVEQQQLQREHALAQAALDQAAAAAAAAEQEHGAHGGGSVPSGTGNLSMISIPAGAEQEGGPPSPGGIPEGEDHDAAGGGDGGASTLSRVGSARNPANAGLDELLYPDLQVFGQLRKVSQIQMFKKQVYHLKVAFNDEFAAAVKLKRAEADKIADLNARLDETAHDLTKLDVHPPVEERFMVPFPEDMASVLTVRDDEVKVDRTALAKAVGAGAGEEGGPAGATMETGALGERALRQMMGGTLASKEEANNEFVLVKPEWMDGNPKLFSEAQLKEIKEFQAKEKALAEEKAKRVAALEAEMRSLRVSVEETAAKFDEALAALLTRRLAVQMDVAALESRIIEFTVNVESCHETSDRAEKELYTRLSAAKEACSRAGAQLAERRALLGDLEGRAAELMADEKQLDRNFKKEFIDTEQHYSKLLQLYRMRLAAQDEEGGSAGGAKGPPAGHRALLSQLSRQLSRQMSRRSDGASGVHQHAKEKDLLHHHPSDTSAITALPPRHEQLLRELAQRTLDPFPQLPASATAPPPEEPEMLDEVYRPEGLDQDWWTKFLVYRAQKIGIEAKLLTLSGQISLLNKEVPKLAAEDERVAAEDEAAMAALTAMRNARRLALYDGGLQLRLKAGQVEAVPPEATSSDMSHAVCVHRTVVEGVNSIVHTKGAKKIEILTAIKDFKKGIYQLEWEHKRCDMMIADLREKTRELQMLHVTRDIQSVFKTGGAEERSVGAETASLEALFKQREQLHKKAIGEKLKRLKKLSKLKDEKQRQNGEVSRHLVTLEKVLYEQERLQNSMQSVDDQMSRRMRSMVTHKRLKEIAEAQASELAALAAELDRLRLRTYPTFVEPARPMMVSPDVKASLYSTQHAHTGGSSWR